jgi:hypothetical protein
VTGAVLLDPRAARAVGSGVLAFPILAVLVGDTGEMFIVRPDGGLDRVIQGGRPHGGIAEDPTARSAA